MLMKHITRTFIVALALTLSLLPYTQVIALGPLGSGRDTGTTNSNPGTAVVSGADGVPGGGTLTITPDPIMSGGSAVLSWNIRQGYADQGNGYSLEYTAPIANCTLTGNGVTQTIYDFKKDPYFYDPNVNGGHFFTTYNNGTTPPSFFINNGTGVISGSMVITPASDTTYSVYCQMVGGAAHAISNVQSGATIWPLTGQITAYVTPSTTNPTATLTANPTSIANGNSTTLTWSSQNSTVCTSPDFTTNNQTSGSVSVTPTTLPSTYTVTCSNVSGKSASAQALVNSNGIPSTVCKINAVTDQTIPFSLNVNIPVGTAWNVTPLYQFDYAANSPAVFGPAAVTTNNNTYDYVSFTTSHRWTAPGTYVAYGRVDSATYVATDSGNNGPTIGDPNGYPRFTFNSMIFSSPLSIQQPTTTSTYCIVTIAAAGNVPNVTAVLTPVHGTVGQAVTLTGVIANTGGAAATNFNSAFMTNLNQQTTQWNTIVNGSPTISSLGANATTTVTATISATAFTAPGSYIYQLCADTNTDLTQWWNGTIDETNEDDNCDTNIITMTNAQSPDLTAGTVTPSTARVGQAVTLSSKVTNTGNAATAVPFPTRFQVLGGDAFLGSDISNLAAAASTTSSGSYTFPSPGVYQVKACANNTIDWVNISDESDYGNNCSDYTPITVTGDPTLNTCNLTSDKASVTNVGDPATLKWTLAGVASCTPSNFSMGSNTNTNGQTTIHVAKNTVYSMSCRMTSGATCNTSVSIPVGGCSPSPTLTLTATPSRITKGASSILHWSASNAKSCVLSTQSGQVLDQQQTPDNSCATLGPSSVGVNPDTQTTYTLNCDGVTKSVIVNVVPQFNEF